MQKPCAPRDLPRSAWYIALTVLTGLLVCLGLCEAVRLVDAVPYSRGIPVADAVLLLGQTVLLVGLFTTILLPGRKAGYVAVNAVLRLLNALLLAVIGVLALCVAALIIMVSMSVISTPVFFELLVVVLLVLAGVTVWTFFSHHVAECLKTFRVSACAGRWLSPTAYRGPVTVLTGTMACLLLLLAVGALLCVVPATNGAIASAYDGVSVHLYDSVKPESRNFIRVLTDLGRPLLETTWHDPLRLALESLRCVALLLLCRTYRRGNAAGYREM